MKYGIVVALMMATLVLCGGCDGFMNKGWRTEQEDVRKAARGWAPSQVAVNIGKPDRVVRFEGVKTGWEEWIYPTGSIFFYRLEVKKVLPRIAAYNKKTDEKPRVTREEDIIRNDDKLWEFELMGESIYGNDPGRHAELDQ